MKNEGQTDLTTPRPGERIQTWWCKDCGEEHTASVLGGVVVPPLEGTPLKSLRDVASEMEEEAFA